MWQQQQQWLWDKAGAGCAVCTRLVKLGDAMAVVLQLPMLMTWSLLLDYITGNSI